MKTTKTLSIMLMACAAVTPSYACDELYPDIREEEINFCRDNQETINEEDQEMANKFTKAVTVIALTLAVNPNLNADIVRSLAIKCNMDETSVTKIAEEVLSAKEVAEMDMNNF